MNKNGQVEVSVLIPVYNCTKFVGEAIESVLKQKGVEFEIVVLDDGSSDDGWKTILSCGPDYRLRAYRRRHRGIGPVRNQLVSLARGRFVVFLDADDVMIPGRLKRQTDCLQKNPDFGVVFGDYFVFDAARKASLTSARPDRLTRNGTSLIPHASLCSAMIRTAALKKIGKFAALPLGEDLDMWLRLRSVTSFHYLAGYTFMYRMHSTNTTLKNKTRFHEMVDELIRRALRRSAALENACISFRMGEVSVSLTSNQPSICRLMKDFIYRDAPKTKVKSSYQIEVYEVPSIAHIYGLENKTTSHYLDEGNTFVWKSIKHQFVGRMERKRRRAIFFAEKLDQWDMDMLTDLFLIYPLIFLTKPMGWHFVHSGAVSKSDRGILIAGPSRSGKSTFSLNFLKKGYKLLSDDTNILHFDGSRLLVRAFPKKMKIRKKLLRACFSRSQTQRFNLKMSGHPPKVVVDPEDQWRNARSDAANLRMILLPQFSPTANSPRIKRISSKEFLSRIKKGTNSYDTFGCSADFLADYLMIFLSLVPRKNIPIYQCDYSDESIVNAVERIDTLLTQGNHVATNGSRL